MLLKNIHLRIVCMICAATAAISASADFSAPDFAFPQTVAHDADSVLRHSNDGLLRLQAVMEIVKAKTEINPDSLQAMPAFIEHWAEKSTDPAIRSIFDLFQAETLSLDRAGSHDDSVKRLVERSMEGIDEWGDIPLSRFANVISINDESKEFFPKLRDFVFTKAISLTSDNEIIKRAIALSADGTPEWAFWQSRQSTPNEMLKLYETHREGIVGGFLLWHYADQQSNDKLKAIGLLEEYLANNRRNTMTEYIANLLWNIRTPLIKVIHPEAVAPGEEFSVKVVQSFASEVGIAIYKVDDIFTFRSKRTKIAEFVADTDSTRINDTIDFKVTVPKAGNYTVAGVLKNFEETSRNESYLTVTDWLPFGVELRNKFVVGVANMTNGNPAQGVTVTLKPGSSAKKTLHETTDHNGFARITRNSDKNEPNGGFITLSKGSAHIQYSTWLSDNTYQPSGTSRQGAVFVARPLYHPGDTIGWTAVVVEKNWGNYSSALMADKEFLAILRDANRQPVDTIKAVSDAYGRIYGQFAIPADRLAGTYQITVQSGYNYICSGSVTVSDFKMPVFEITGLTVAKEDSCYVVRGRAARYTGAGVPDADVEVEIRQNSYWGRWSAATLDAGPYTASGTTLADGSFAVSVPVDDSGLSDIWLNYQCTVNVTSVNADFATASTRVRPGKPYLLAASLNSNEIDGGKPVEVQLATFDNDMKFAPLKLKWTLSRQKEDQYSGTCMSDSVMTALDWTDVAPGRYELTVCAALDTAVCNTVNLGELWVYNSAKNQIPPELRLVIPQTEYKNVTTDYVEVLVGVGQKTYVYTFGNTLDDIAAAAELLAPGFHTLRITIDSRKNQEAMVVVVADKTTFQKRLSVARADNDKKIRIVGESWRDKLTPGAGERWTLRLSDSQGRGISGAMVATLYNAALNALVQGRQWPSLAETLSAPVKHISHQFTWESFSESSSLSTDYRMLKYPSISIPMFIYTPEIRRVRRNLISRPAMNYSRSMKAAPVNDYAEEVYAEGAYAESFMICDSEASLATDSVAGDASSPEVPEFDFRQAETLQAFWMPALNVGKDGSAIIEFTMPNAIGMWDFRSTAWTKDMRAATITASLRSSKPVMVEPSLPRFMRRGDSARVGATVINNTDSPAKVVTTIEVFNPADGKVITTHTTESLLDANGQTVVYADIEAAVGLDAAGYRVRSSNGEFTDGEQSTIPILESSTIAIDSDIFYLTKDQKTFTATIAADTSGEGIVAIEYCQNPVWDAVKTLPGLYELEPRTATSAATSAYAALTAMWLYERYPEIKQVLDIWRGNPADSSLVSDLAKNQDIKLAALAQTPFVGAANANTERMERLAATFDANIIRRMLSAAAKKLETLQQSDGGFKWGAWTPMSSEWMTRQVLLTLSQIPDKSLLDSNKQLSKVVDSALGYLDSKVKANQSDITYALIYSRFPGKKPRTQSGVQAIDLTVQEIIKSWKQHPTAQKAQDALILKAFGNEATARLVMSSITQFAQNSPRKGVVFPSVTMVDSYSAIMNAYAAIEPESPLLDGMRRWLILQTQTTDNLGAWNPAPVVAALLSTGTRWTTNPSMATADVAIDGRRLPISKVEAATGAFSMRLAPSASPRAITFTCPDNTAAAYGSVLTISSVPLSKVEPRQSADLAVTKTLKVKREGKWVEADEFLLGETVQVEITLDARSDLEYIMVRDDRPAGFEPKDQMPGWVGSAYREVGDSSTNLFITRMPRGIYQFQYEVVAAYSGRFASGTASAQSQYAPEVTARSGAQQITISPLR